MDASADENLMPMIMFAKLFPKISLNTFQKTVETGVNLYAYNPMPIKQFGVYSLKLSFKGKTTICKFYIVEHATAILGIADSEKLSLVKVNFDMINKSSSVKLVHIITSGSLKKELRQNFQSYSKESAA